MTKVLSACNTKTNPQYELEKYVRQKNKSQTLYENQVGKTGMI